ncbi:hypothetical protein [Moorena sp. SIO4G3]|uniref:hypothetical protein n=1 Tax=Moorena sp. SIO4G3 TaxID=2607821 RepID=UPI0034206E23
MSLGALSVGELNSPRVAPVDRCSIDKEYIIPADTPFPSYHRQQNNLPKAKKTNPFLALVHSQVLQTTVRRLHDSWEAMQSRGFGFPRFKKRGQYKSFVFPQFKSNPVSNAHIKLPTRCAFRWRIKFATGRTSRLA